MRWTRWTNRIGSSGCSVGNVFCNLWITLGFDREDKSQRKTLPSDSCAVTNLLLATHTISVALQVMPGRVDNCASVPASHMRTLISSPQVAMVLDPMKTACLIARSLCTVDILSSVKHGDNNDAEGEDWKGREGITDVSLPIL